MRKIFYFIFMLLFITVACEQIIEENIKTPITEANFEGNWTVNAYIDDIMVFGPFTITTQMTSDNKSLHVKDNGGFWNFQTKTDILRSKEMFESVLSANEICKIGAKINIINGSVINKDSINFDIQFEDDETPFAITYKIMGNRN